MKKILEIQVKSVRIPLSDTSIQALQNLNRYDLIVFTSKNARKLFSQELKEWHITLPRQIRIIQVGPRNDLLKFPVRGKLILFPRSVLAPYDIVQRLRAKGATIRVLPLYTAHCIPLSFAQKKSLLEGNISALYFKSPSGVVGLLKQLSKKEKGIALRVPAQCIGETTAGVAKAAGFKQVRVKNV